MNKRGRKGETTETKGKCIRGEAGWLRFSAMSGGMGGGNCQRYGQRMREATEAGGGLR